MGIGELGVREVLALAIACCGLALIISAFLEWGRARAAGLVYGDAAVARASFPGIGDVKVSLDVSDMNSQFRNWDAFHNTNPGWIAILFGVLVLALGIGYWRLNRVELVIAAAIVGFISTVVISAKLLDVRGTFGDQSGFAGAEVSPGVGLIGACVLSVAVVGLAIAALVVDRRSSRNAPGV